MRKLTLGTKIAFGFSAILLLAVILGAVAIVNMFMVEQKTTMIAEEYMPEIEIANEIERFSLLAMYENRGYGFSEEASFLEAGRKNLTTVHEQLQLAKELADKSEHLKVLTGSVETTVEALKEYEDHLTETENIIKGMANLRSKLDDAAAKYMRNCSDFLTSQNLAMIRDTKEGKDIVAIKERLDKITWVNDVIDFGNAVRIANWKAQATRDPESLEQALKYFDDIDEYLEKLESITRLQVNQDQITATRRAANTYKTSMKEFLDNWSRLQTLNTLRNDTAALVLENSKNIAVAGVKTTATLSEEADSSLSSAINTIMIGLVVALIVGAVLSVLISRSITGPVMRVIEGLAGGADSVDSAADQVASSSQTMAEGASEQASSLEEVSSSLEEMSAMTSQNASNASEANSLAISAKETATTGSETMVKMNEAIYEIKASADETAQIVKTIDEIAFQTNLLALNAAVEAARAGDAGKGFAVVAEEVRNLAQRSAEAAKNTARLIKESQLKSDHGVEVSADVSKVLEEIVGISGKVTGLVSEVASASREQAEGISEVNRAVAEMDKVTQANAANAEESSSAAEELSAQASELKGMVNVLVGIVGNVKEQKEPKQMLPGRPAIAKQKQLQGMHISSSPAKPSMSPQKSLNSTLNPEEVIPLDEDEMLEDF
jgi:methyl-accepting chemotaxis protein